MRNNIVSKYQSRQSTLSSMEHKWRTKKDRNIDKKRLLEISNFAPHAPTDEAKLFDYKQGVVIVAGDVAKIKETLTPWTFTAIDLDSLLDGEK